MTSSNISRRELLKRLGGGVAVLGVGGGVAHLTLDDGSARPRQAGENAQTFDRRVPGERSGPDLCVTRRGTPAELVRTAVETVGGIGSFIERGDSVFIKPNIGWDRIPLLAANTNPLVVATLVELCREAGARRIVVGDVSCNDPRRAYDRSGIARAAREAGAEVLLPDRSRMEPTDIAGHVLGRWPIFNPLLNCNKLINVPVVKNHTLASLTCATKNWFGLLGGSRGRLHQNIHDTVADLALAVRPTLTIVDAVRVMHRNGPTGGDTSDTRRLDTIIAGVDQVAADTYACRLIGLQPAQISYLARAARRGGGRNDVENLDIREIDLG